ncbi:hypothetical protein CEXT_193211 [Caerostris extrusa]|uniref:PiggyBac transposable element-derived protein domain-containing protein n=1 Tax=Caerostris extrusa TaxID=172846 RepID=A0AAV4UVZ5_CAEEX|nr:hypothetical protein CEXT_193211 [Caerostris extrusa]
MVDNFFRTTKEASVQSEFVPEKIYFDKLHNRYNKRVQAKRKYRLCVWDTNGQTYVSGVSVFHVWSGERSRPIPRTLYKLLWLACCFIEFRKDFMQTKMYQKGFFFTKINLCMKSLCCNPIRPTAFLREHDI